LSFSTGESRTEARWQAQKLVCGASGRVEVGYAPTKINIKARREPKALHVQRRDICAPDLHIDTLKVKPRNFR